MALHSHFPTSPYDILPPEVRWFPADEALRASSYEKLLPPLVATLRKKVHAWREKDYAGASPTSHSLLNWWFKTEHLAAKVEGPASPFRYYYAQREAVETVIYLYDVVKIKDKYDLLRYDSSQSVSMGMFAEEWRRLVVKMATGSGKTKVLSLILAWAFFHKTYEANSELARNFLVIAPNIIVLDRLYHDFKNLEIFSKDPILPDNGYGGQNWRDDFQLTLHLQDDVRVVGKTGNIFLTNIHRVYSSDAKEASFADEDTRDYFFGRRPKGKTTDSKVDLGDLVRDIDELVVLNDEAHHIHDSKLAWFKSIEDIHHKLVHKGHYLSLQVDVTATPRRNNGAIFGQTVSDYPLVEAVSQNVVKHPVLPDEASRAKLAETQSSIFTKRYVDYIKLGVEEWRKAYVEHEKLGQKAILFVMTDDTRNCDDVAEYLEDTFPELKGAVMTIHTNKSGDIAENVTGKSKEELDTLRKQANNIDSWDSPYKAIVSVLMLKEGWDVRNVTTIVGLRAYSAKSNILPEQTLGRGLRLMYFGKDVKEYVSVVGTDAFMDFVESIQSEGVLLEQKPMGEGTAPKAPVIVEVDKENDKKDLQSLDMEIPVLTPRTYREYQNLEELSPASFEFQKMPYRQFTEAEKREIVFRDITTSEVSHVTTLDTGLAADYTSVIGYFTQVIMKDLRLVSGYDVLYGKVKECIKEHLFTQSVELGDLNTLRNLSESPVTKTIIDTFKKYINALTVQDRGGAEIKNYLKLTETRPFIAKEQAFFMPQKSVFNKIIGDSDFELDFANFLEKCSDIISYAKNYLAVHFTLDYINSHGFPSNYYPDFLVKVSPKDIVIVETKGLEELQVPQKMERLKQWCEDINKMPGVSFFDYVFVDEASFHKYKPACFGDLMRGFRRYKD